MTQQKQAYFQLKEGNHIGVIAEAITIEPRFQNSKAPFEVKITAVTKEYGKADLYFDMSADYDNKGNRKCEVSLNNLAELGLVNSDMTKLADLKGNPISFFGKTNDKGYTNFFLSKNFDVEVDANDANAKLQAMLGTGSGAGNPAANAGGGNNGLMQAQQGSGEKFDPFAVTSADSEDDIPF